MSPWDDRFFEKNGQRTRSLILEIRESCPTPIDHDHDSWFALTQHRVLICNFIFERTRKENEKGSHNDFVRTILLNRWKGSHEITLDIIFCLNNLRNFLRFLESFSYLEERPFLVLFVANTGRFWWYSPLWKNKEDYTLLSFTIRRVVYAHRSQAQAHALMHTHTFTWECARLYQIRTHTHYSYIYLHII